MGFRGRKKQRSDPRVSRSRTWLRLGLFVDLPRDFALSLNEHGIEAMQKTTTGELKVQIPLNPRKNIFGLIFFFPPLQPCYLLCECLE